MMKINLLTGFCFMSFLLIEVNTDNNIVEQTTKLLTNKSFTTDIATGLSAVLLYADWCGHSRKIYSIWNQLGEKYNEHDVIKVRRVDCGSRYSRDLCSSQHLNGFPTINFYKKGHYVREYEGKILLGDLADAIESHLSYAGKKNV